MNKSLFESGRPPLTARWLGKLMHVTIATASIRRHYWRLDRAASAAETCLPKTRGGR